MSYLFNLLAIVAAILLVAKIQQLRGVLSMQMPRHDTAVVDPPPAQERDPVFDELGQGLAPLGFGEPVWLEARRRDGEEAVRSLSAAYPSPDGGWVRASAPIAATMPHTPIYFFAHRLADGRTAISQAFDIYYEMVQCAPLVARTAREATLEAQWQAHLEWLRSLGSEVVALPQEELVQEISRFEEELHRALLACGKARRLTPDLLSFRLATAVRIVWKFGRSPKPVADPRPVPVSRLAALAMASERLSHRSPPRDVQLGLFAFTAALFMVAGWLLWHDPWLALIILVVVLVHELGHFFAMRAFGYRNVHILALPLVGGVTIGQDVAPTASKRAWMSLMGPLPGILIGWALVWLMLSGLAADIPHLVPLAITFLAVNYLNILPIPPLDGAHVVEAMLPARWARAQTIFLGVAALAGAALAFYFGMPILVFLALLQLFALKARWQAHAAESVFTRLRLPEDRQTRLQEIFRILDGRAGPAETRGRVAQGLRVLHRLDIKPMGWPALLLTSAVYASLLVVPLAALAYVGWAQPFSAPANNEQWRVVEAQRVEWRKAAKSASYADLLARLAGADPEQPRPMPAGAEAFRAAEARLHRAIPDDLRAFYETSDGLPAESIASLAELRELTPNDVIYADGEGRAITVYPSSGRPVQIKASEAVHWWFLGGQDSTLYYLPDPDSRLPGVRVVDAWPEDPTTHASMREYLEMQYVANEEVAYYETQHAARVAKARQRLAKAEVPELLSVWPRPGLAQSLAGKGWPGPAGEQALQGAEARIGMRFPDDLRRALATHDGFPPLHLLPSAEMDTVERKAAMLDDRARIGSDVARCVVVAATRPDPRSHQTAIFPTLFWCPANGAEAWVEVNPRKTWPSFQQWLLERSTERAAADG